jgi:thymidine phosphorylase
MAEDESAYSILERKREGLTLSEGQIRTVVAGTTDGSWDDSQITAFLMAATIRGLDADETRWLTVAMLQSGER